MIVPRPLTGGIYVAALSLFAGEQEALDLELHRQHIIRMVKAGLKAIILMGSNGEAPHLSLEERIAIIHATRSVLDENGFKILPIIAGCSDQSVAGTVKLCRDAGDAGADYALVLPPSYFRPAMTVDVILSFYQDVAQQSPIPIILYSFPTVVAGIELDSDILIAASQHPNVVGTKFTCADTGKLNRVATAMDSARPGYASLGGLADFILPGLVAGATGMIVGGGNVAPHTCVRVYDLWSNGELPAAQDVQRILSAGDWAHTRMGVGGTKAVLQRYFGYGGSPRRPLRLPGDESVNTRNMFSEIEPLMKMEAELQATVGSSARVRDV